MIHITKEGFKRFEWNGDLRLEVEAEFESIHCLRDGITEIEEEVTLGDIITFTYKDIFLRGFIGCYSSCDVGTFYRELQCGVKPLSKLAVNHCSPSSAEKMPNIQGVYMGATANGELSYCTVAMEAEVSESHKYKISKSLDISLDFHGCGNDGKVWSLDLVPLGEIAALPFRLETNASVDHFLDGNFETESGLRYTPSLLEVLDAIFFDISFHGSPADKAGVTLDLERMMKEIENGTAELVPHKMDEDEMIQ